LSSLGSLPGVWLRLKTNVSGLTICPIFRVHFLTLKMGQIKKSHFLNLKMGQTVSPETLVFNLNQTPSTYPKEDNLNILNHGESLKFNNISHVIYRHALITYLHTEFHVSSSCCLLPTFTTPRTKNKYLNGYHIEDARITRCPAG
jgi:hypothetical protein